MAGGPRAAAAIAVTERTRGRGPCISRNPCRTPSACSARPNGTVGTSSSVVLNAQDPSGGPYKDVGGGGAARKGQNPDFRWHFHGLGAPPPPPKHGMSSRLTNPRGSPRPPAIP